MDAGKTLRTREALIALDTNLLVDVEALHQVPADAVKIAAMQALVPRILLEGLVITAQILAEPSQGAAELWPRPRRSPNGGDWPG